MQNSPMCPAWRELARRFQALAQWELTKARQQLVMGNQCPLDILL